MRGGAAGADRARPRSLATPTGSVVGQRVGEQRAGERSPGPARIRSQWLGHSGEERVASLGRVEIAGEREHGRIVGRRVAMRVAARGVDEQRAADRGVALPVAQGDVAAGAEGGDDQLDVVSRSGTRLRSSRA
jgi:hypothetical protein